MAEFRHLQEPPSDGLRGGENREWLGRQDSNLRMAASKAAALPLGDAPAEPTIDR
jgi:hypothetical protein